MVTAIPVLHGANIAFELYRLFNSGKKRLRKHRQKKKTKKKKKKKQQAGTDTQASQSTAVPHGRAKVLCSKCSRSILLQVEPGEQVDQSTPLFAASKIPQQAPPVPHATRPTYIQPTIQVAQHTRAVEVPTVPSAQPPLQVPQGPRIDIVHLEQTSITTYTTSISTPQVSA